MHTPSGCPIKVVRSMLCAVCCARHWAGEPAQERGQREVDERAARPCAHKHLAVQLRQTNKQTNKQTHTQAAPIGVIASDACATRGAVAPSSDCAARPRPRPDRPCLAGLAPSSNAGAAEAATRRKRERASAGEAGGRRAAAHAPGCRGKARRHGSAPSPAHRIEWSAPCETARGCARP